MTDDAEPKVEEPAPEPEPTPLPEPDPPKPETNDAEVTVEPSETRAEVVEVELPIEATDVQVRSATKREIEVRLLPWDTIVETIKGPEMFSRGAFSGTPQDGVLLFGLEHEVSMGLGQDGRTIVPIRRAMGRSTSVWEADDGPHVAFRVARTQGGDDLLALAEDRVIRNVSLEFSETPGGTSVIQRSGRRVRDHKRVALSGTSMTYRPAYGEQAAVLAVRSQEPNTEIAPMADQEAPVAGAMADEHRLAGLIDAIEARSQVMDGLLAKFEERDRKNIEIPAKGTEPTPSKGEWIQTVVRLMTGERVPEVQMRALADVITTDNAGVVPPTYLTELIGVIDSRRPFLSTTRRLDTPATGMKLTVPVITQRPLAGVQATEKAEVASRKTIITAEDFNAVTIAGAGDLSIQLIKRSSPNFLNLWVELLAEAYAIEAEDQALLALFAAIGGVGGASSIDPDNLSLGAAFVASFDAIRRPPDTIWLSTQAVGEFIDAKATTTNQPLYPGLRASATAAGGIEGVISGLRPVHVPTLDAHGSYAIVGPSSGFAWAEDGTYQLEVDVPAKAGRDVALVGMLWLCPWYPAAFTAYNVAS